MAHDLPYVNAYGKIGQLFERVSKAKIPDVFTVKFLNDSIGLKSTSDRSLIPLLKRLGFLDSSGKPTNEYAKLKNKTTASAAIARGIKQAYAPLYAANEDAHNLSPEDLKGLVAQVSGAEDSLISFIVGTLKSLFKAADFSKSTTNQEDKTEKIEGRSTENNAKGSDNGQTGQEHHSAFNPDFKFNIEIHLPSNGTEETYLAIFNALRKSLG